MINIIQNIVQTLVTDTTLSPMMNLGKTVIPNKSIYVGPVDIVKEQQITLQMPLIVLMAVSESFRTVPQNCRDSRIQLDIWSRNSESELENIYEQVEFDLNYVSDFYNNTRIFWQRSGGMRASYETDIRLWHWALDFVVWSN